MSDANCDQCGGAGWYLTPPLECRDGKFRQTRCKCSCGHGPLAKLARENADLRAKLAAAEKDRDEQREAVRVLGEEAYRHRVDREGNGVRGMSIEMMAVNANPTAAAAVKEASGASE